MNKRKVNIILKGYGKKPMYATQNSSGADLHSASFCNVKLFPTERKIIPTGVYLELPEDCEAQVRPRSGLSIKNGIVAIFGTIDADYRGEVGIILINLSNEIFEIKRGDRLAQLVFNGSGGLFQADFNEVEFFEKKTERGENGFGHSGI